MISVAISLFGAHLSGKVQEEIALRKALYEFLVYTKCCIENGNLPLPEIYSSFKNEIFEKHGITDNLKKSQTNAIKNALDNCPVKLDPAIKSLYFKLSESIGKSHFRVAESETLARYISLVEIEEKKLLKNDLAKKELYKKLGILCGLMAALILV